MAGEGTERLSASAVDWSSHAPMGCAALFYESLDSSNEEARRRLAAGWNRSPLWLIARQQTAGRGRLGRHWASACGNFTGSLLVPVAPFAAVVTVVSLAVGLAVRHTIAAFIGDPRRVQVKWPNDVLIDGAKVSGILIEREEQEDALVIGIGVNLVFAPDQASQTVMYPAISLRGAGASVPAPVSFFERLASNVARYLGRLQQGPVSPLLQEWCDQAFGLGERHLVTIQGEKTFATLLRLNEDASLTVALDDGRECCLYAGDIGSGQGTEW